MQPFFSIISVARNDAWALTKTARSVFRQGFKGYEYIIVDGGSTDGSQGLIEFWCAQQLVTRHVSEPDSGVYNAMNKALGMARGEFVCFLNAGDVFAADDVLQRVRAWLDEYASDGVLGWGELGGQVWASWSESEAFKAASMGFCHQALFVRRPLLNKYRFDERPFKTDSDTLQLGRMYAAGAKIPIVPEILAIRGTEPGISANLQRTKSSICNTLVEQYSISTAMAEDIVAFRRECIAPEKMLTLMEESRPPLRTHLALMTLDTLFLRQSKKLQAAIVEELFDAAQATLLRDATAHSETTLSQLFRAQEARHRLMETRRVEAAALKKVIQEFDAQEIDRLTRLKKGAAPRTASGAPRFVVSLTSFPARIPTLHLVIQSLVEQSCPPDEIHVWLGSDEVPKRNWLPGALLKFEQRGLKVHFAPRTFHQYDKFMHNAELNAECPFVIVDDDVIYPPDSMESLLLAHRDHPGAVIANRCHMMGVTEDGEIAPYTTWRKEVRLAQPRLGAFPTGAGGVLYPPGFLSVPMVTNVRDVLAHAPYADDIWLKVCALARRIPTMTTPLSEGSKWYLRYTPTMRSGALHATNVDLGLNDMQLRRCMEWLDRKRPQWKQELETEAVAT